MFFRPRVILAVGVVGTSAAAQSPAPHDTLGAAVITATRVAVSTAAPTATTTVLAGDDVRAQGITRVADALALLPGAMVVGSGAVGSQTSLFLRGGNSNYVRVLVDGVPVNDAGGFVDLANFSMSNVSRIEVVRGPASVLYGSDAVTGVVQVFTADGRGPAGVRASVGGGTYGTVRADVEAHGGTGRAGYTLGVARDATSGILAFNNRYENTVGSGALTLAPDARTDVRIAARWSAATFHYPTDYAGNVVDHNAEQSDHRLTASIDAGRRFGDRLELRATLSSNEYLPRSNDGPDDAADTSGFYGYFSRSTRTRRTADVRVNARFARGTLTVGGEASHDHETSTSRSLSEFGPSDDAFEADRHIGGVYAQLIGDVTPRLSYSAGIRRDDNSAFGTFTTGRASLAYLLGATTRLRVAAGNAFKAPSFYENFASGYVTGNPDLRPEESRSVEAGLETFLADGALRLAVTGYAQRFENIVQYTGSAPSPGAPNYYNVAAADANGLELEASWRTRRDVRAALAYAWTDTRVTQTGFDSSAGASYVKGERLIRRPPHTVSVSLGRAYANGGSWRLVALRVGERDDRDFRTYPTAPTTLPAYVKVDASAVIPTRKAGVQLLLRADNAFGAQYEDVVGFPAPGATFFGGVRIER